MTTLTIVWTKLLDARSPFFWVLPLGTDLDGVLCSDYPKPLPDTSESEYRACCIHHARTAHLVGCLPWNFPSVAIITGRREFLRSYTVEWLRRYNIEYTELLMMPDDDHTHHSPENIARFKLDACRKLGIRTYFEDDENIIAAMANICGVSWEPNRDGSLSI